MLMGNGRESCWVARTTPLCVSVKSCHITDRAKDRVVAVWTLAAIWAALPPASLSNVPGGGGPGEDAFFQRRFRKSCSHRSYGLSYYECGLYRYWLFPDVTGWFRLFRQKLGTVLAQLGPSAREQHFDTRATCFVVGCGIDVQIPMRPGNNSVVEAPREHRAPPEYPSTHPRCGRCAAGGVDNAQLPRYTNAYE